jgi:hypothetical protein
VISADDVGHLSGTYGGAREFMQAYLQKVQSIENVKTKKILKKLKFIRLQDDDLILNEEEYKVSKRTAKINSGKQFCKTCKKILFCAPNEGNLLCKFCGKTQKYVDMNSASMTYNGDADESQTQYDKCTHLMDIIEPFRPRAWEKNIPQKVFDDLKALIRQNRYGIHKELNVAKIANYLQHLGYTELYEHKYQIMMMINGVILPTMTQIQEWKIMFAFLMLQPAFEAIKDTKSLLDPSTSSSALKYELTCYHICRMNNYNEFCPHLKLLQVAPRHRKQLRHLLLMMKKCGLTYIPQMY